MDTSSRRAAEAVEELREVRMMREESDIGSETADALMKQECLIMFIHMSELF